MSAYINRFQTYLTNLNRIDGENMSSSEAKHLFLDHIVDDDYKMFKTVLMKDINTSTLENLINNMRTFNRNAVAHGLLKAEGLLAKELATRMAHNPYLPNSR